MDKSPLVTPCVLSKCISGNWRRFVLRIIMANWRSPCKTETEKIERFWSFVDIGESDECWIWKGATQNNRQGHGAFSSGISWWGTAPAHRIALLLYESVSHFDRLSFQACHTCNNPPCCNPRHLYWGTHKTNADDRTRIGNSANKLNVDNVLSIRQAYKKYSTKYGSVALGKLYNVDNQTILDVVHKKLWKHI